MEITASGKRGKLSFTVKVTKDDSGEYVFLIKDCPIINRAMIEETIREEMEKQHVFAGTYIPPVESDINVMNVIENYLFDKKDIMIAKDITPMPHKEGVIY